MVHFRELRKEVGKEARHQPMPRGCCHNIGCPSFHSFQDLESTTAAACALTSGPSDMANAIAHQRHWSRMQTGKDDVAQFSFGNGLPVIIEELDNHVERMNMVVWRKPALSGDLKSFPAAVGVKDWRGKGSLDGCAIVRIKSIAPGDQGLERQVPSPLNSS